MNKSSEDLYNETLNHFLEISKSRPKKELEENYDKNIWSKNSYVPDMLKYDYKNFDKKICFYKRKNRRVKEKNNKFDND